MVLSSILAALAAVADGGDAQGEAQLERYLEGRVAGEPVECIRSRDVRRTRIAHRTAILYETPDAIYVARPAPGSKLPTRWHVLGKAADARNYCTGYALSLSHLGKRAWDGLVILGPLVPYRRTAD